MGPGAFQGQWRSGWGRSSGPSASLDLSCFLGHFTQKIKRRALPISTRCLWLTLYPQDRSHPLPRAWCQAPHVTSFLTDVPS